MMRLGVAPPLTWQPELQVNDEDLLEDLYVLELVAWPETVPTVASLQPTLDDSWFD